MGFAPLGYHPTLTREAAQWMPKGRYAIMRRYMPQVGSMGLDMMLRTCTVQVNLDYADEADMRRKLFVSLALQPLATALFANSPFKEGQARTACCPTGRMSGRMSMRPVPVCRRLMFADDFGFERFTQLAARHADVFHQARRPLRRHGRSVVPRLHGRASARRRRRTRPRSGDWADHVTTAFTDVRREAVSGDARRGCR